MLNVIQGLANLFHKHKLMNVMKELEISFTSMLNVIEGLVNLFYKHEILNVTEGLVNLFYKHTECDRRTCKSV